MGAFADMVFDAVVRIPHGYVSTYGDVARAIGKPRAARYVGYALRANPRPGQDKDSIPCHRVIFGDGKISEGFAFGGPDVQRALLQSEGVPFIDDMHVDLDKCRWQFTADALGRPTDIDWAAEMGD